jgi:predicted nucleic acid-binding protein
LKKYALDTNLYILTIRDPGAAAELQSFYSTFAPGTYLSSVVLHELLVGATSVAKAREIRVAMAEPFRRGCAGSSTSFRRESLRSDTRRSTASVTW